MITIAVAVKGINIYIDMQQVVYEGNVYDTTIPLHHGNVSRPCISNVLMDQCRHHLG